MSGTSERVLPQTRSPSLVLTMSEAQEMMIMTITVVLIIIYKTHNFIMMIAFSVTHLAL